MLCWHVLLCGVLLSGSASTERYSDEYLNKYWQTDSQYTQMGNLLSLYWHHRAIALVTASTLEVFPPNKAAQQLSWLSLLSLSAPSTKLSDAADNLVSIKEAATVCQAGRGREAPHLCVGTWTNPHMIPIIRSESRRAIDSFFAPDQNIEVNADGTAGQARGEFGAQSLGKGDVAIHFRCGDVLGGRAAHRLYGMLPWGWYVRRITDCMRAGMVVQRLVLVGNTIRGDGRNSHTRKQDRAKQDQCVRVQVELKRYLQSKLGSWSRNDKEPVEVVFWGQSVSHDFRALTKAEALIGSISSFSLWAAVLHDRAEQLTSGSTSGSASLIVLPICDLFFQKQTIPLPGVRWVEVEPIWSRDMAALDVEDVIARLKGLGSDDSAFQ
jgi:hypothetical protein